MKCEEPRKSRKTQMKDRRKRNSQQRTQCVADVPGSFFANLISRLSRLSWFSSVRREELNHENDERPEKKTYEKDWNIKDRKIIILPAMSACSRRQKTDFPVVLLARPSNRFFSRNV